jgi:hypothetical protein
MSITAKTPSHAPQKAADEATVPAPVSRTSPCFEHRGHVHEVYAPTAVHEVFALRGAADECPRT